jgi:ubiquinone/menaquinone biosynthesis C-methylase UbiE
VIGTDDLSADMLMIANEHAISRGLKNYSTKVADVCELPFADSTFSAVSCRMGFMFIMWTHKRKLTSLDETRRLKAIFGYAN